MPVRYGCVGPTLWNLVRLSFPRPARVLRLCPASLRSARRRWRRRGRADKGRRRMTNPPPARIRSNLRGGREVTRAGVRLVDVRRGQRTGRPDHTGDPTRDVAHHEASRRARRGSRAVSVDDAALPFQLILGNLLHVGAERRTGIRAGLRDRVPSRSGVADDVRLRVTMLELVQLELAAERLQQARGAVAAGV